jgi:DNA-binding MarR family transcriptional regulator
MFSFDPRSHGACGLQKTPESAGLVRRVSCEGDQRGVQAEITDHGREVLAAAAPTHVTGVREHFIDLMSDEEITVLSTVFARIQDHLRQEGK